MGSCLRSCHYLQRGLDPEHFSGLVLLELWDLMCITPTFIQMFAGWCQRFWKCTDDLTKWAGQGSWTSSAGVTFSLWLVAHGWMHRGRSQGS